MAKGCHSPWNSILKCQSLTICIKWTIRLITFTFEIRVIWTIKIVRQIWCYHGNINRRWTTPPDKGLSKGWCCLLRDHWIESGVSRSFAVACTVIEEESNQQQKGITLELNMYCTLQWLMSTRNVATTIPLLKNWWKFSASLTTVVNVTKQHCCHYMRWLLCSNLRTQQSESRWRFTEVLAAMAAVKRGFYDWELARLLYD